MVASDDIYKEDVDFTALAMQHAGFAKRLKPNGQLDFSDPESVRQLTKALLRRDFNLNIELPEDRLCPPVPNRFNYIVFIQKLLDSTNPDYSKTSSTERIIGLDISSGTGASAIYPLLACRQRPNFFFLASELDETSRGYAIANIKNNGLSNQIKVVPPDTDTKDEVVKILPTSQFSQFDDSRAEMTQSARLKCRPPNSACTGAPVEMITSGGEIGFITQLIDESSGAINRRKILWFSSMLGKLSSLAAIIGILRQRECTNYVVGEFVQGSKTRRWVVAWSWTGMRPASVLARGISGLEKRLLPFPSEFEFEVASDDVGVVFGKVDDEVRRLRLDWTCVEGMTGLGRSRDGDVWSRKARRQQQMGKGIDQMMSEVRGHGEEGYDDSLPLAFRIIVRVSHSGRMQIVVSIRWLQGHDSVLFESFCGWLKRKIESNHSAPAKK